VYEVCDDRRLLNSLPQWEGVLPFNELTGLSVFQRLREQESSGPTLNEADREMLDWLIANATLSDETIREVTLAGCVRPPSPSGATKNR
jgi:hypothetical protein